MSDELTRHPAVTPEREAELVRQCDMLYRQLLAANEQLRRVSAAAQFVLLRTYTDDDVLNRNTITTVECEALRQLAKALTAPEPPAGE